MAAACSRDSNYHDRMTIDELTPEAIAIMKLLQNNPQPMGESPMLQLLFSDRVVMGSLNKVHLTAMGGRMLAQIGFKRANSLAQTSIRSTGASAS